MMPEYKAKLVDEDGFRYWEIVLDHRTVKSQIFSKAAADDFAELLNSETAHLRNLVPESPRYEVKFNMPNDPDIQALRDKVHALTATITKAAMAIEATGREAELIFEKDDNGNVQTVTIRVKEDS